MYFLPSSYHTECHCRWLGDNQFFNADKVSISRLMTLPGYWNGSGLSSSTKVFSQLSSISLWFTDTHTVHVGLYMQRYVHKTFDRPLKCSDNLKDTNFHNYIWFRLSESRPSIFSFCFVLSTVITLVIVLRFPIV